MSLMRYELYRLTTMMNVEMALNPRTVAFLGMYHSGGRFLCFYCDRVIGGLRDVSIHMREAQELHRGNRDNISIMVHPVQGTF
jgi:hypothetical protein